jgi:polar amino acid transport system substrate-binding protein
MSLPRLRAAVPVVLLCAMLASGAALAQPAPVRLATQHYPPYINVLDGQPEGAVVDVVREAFRRTGYPLRFEVYPWSRALALVQVAQVDGLFTIKKTPERERSLRFPRQPVLQQDYVFFVRRDAGLRFDGNFAALTPARIGVVMNTSYGNRFDEALAQGVFPRVEKAPSYDAVFGMLLSGRVDATICSREVAYEILRRLDPGSAIIEAGPPAETAFSYLVFARSKHTEALAEAFDAAIESMQRDGSFARLSRREGGSQPMK